MNQRKRDALMGGIGTILGYIITLIQEMLNKGN